MLNVKLNFMPLHANFSRSIDVVERVGVYAQSLTAFAYVGRDTYTALPAGDPHLLAQTLTCSTFTRPHSGPGPWAVTNDFTVSVMSGDVSTS